MKNKFIDNEIWILTFGGAFQRSGIYISGTKDGKKIEFRNQLRIKIEELVQQYKSNVDEIKHINNINELIDASVNEALKDGKLRFGIAQKLFNLYLKYEWCRGKIEEPPHCPVDRIVLSELNRNNPESWTKIIDDKQYLKLIADLKFKASLYNESLAIWELNVFNRRDKKNYECI